MAAAHAVHAPAATLSPLAYVERALSALRGWLLVTRTERELAELSPRQLADIGLDAPRLPRPYREALLSGTTLR